jgi:PhnB protein
MTVPMDKRPDRYRNAVVAHIYVEGAADAIDFYERAFGATELFRVVGKNGKIVHGEIAICSSVVMIGDLGDSDLYGEPRKLGGCTAGLHVMVDDNEALLRRATAAGAEEVQPVTDMFYGASAGSVRDPFGNVWVLLAWKEDPDAAEIERRGAALLSQ